MGSYKNVKDSKVFCDQVFSELSAVKERIIRLRHETGDMDNEMISAFDRHLAEIAEEIDWKIQILAHSCNYEWKGSDEFENDVQVSETERSPESDRFSPGYVGG